MRRKTIFSLVLVTFALTLPVLAQNSTVEYGHPIELHGVKKVFVDTGVDIELRNSIVKEIQKGLPTLTVVSNPEDADIHLRFSLKDEDNYAVIIPAKGRVGISSVRTGMGTVLKVINDKRVRVLWSYKDSQRTFVERRPSTNFGREFVKLYERYN
jgi:hypothetical protein